MDELEKEVQQQRRSDQPVFDRRNAAGKGFANDTCVTSFFCRYFDLDRRELDPSHFVLMGDGEERILGISKKIAMVMRETGYLSAGRIARIDAEQLNSMDLMQFKSQLKGNCLLVCQSGRSVIPNDHEGFFSIMDEYYGDFAVILSDEGATLDQLFRFVPALARNLNVLLIFHNIQSRTIDKQSWKLDLTGF